MSGLVLQRKRGQRVVITLPDRREVVVELLDATGGSARMLFHGPRDIAIDREEVANERRPRQSAALAGGRGGVAEKRN